MTKYYEKTATRMYTLDLVKAWAKGEENLGLKNSLFVMNNGIVTQYVDSDEGEKFHEFVKNLTEDEFNEVCDNFFEAIKKEDKVEMFKALTIFDEMDNYSLGNENMKRRLLRVRISTNEIAYKLK